MPKITTKSIYALAAIFFLYQNREKLPLNIETIAQGAHLPKNFLEQLLLLLKKAGILKSIRGAHGGYTFAKEPNRITVLDIVKAVESECCTDLCKTQNPILQLFWRDFSHHIQSFLAKPITALEEYRKKQSSMFFI